jgi:SAM-dependent methyltransferase
MKRDKFRDKHYKTIEQVEQHYKIEKRLAQKLRNSTKEERKELYSAVYDELYQSLPNNSISLRNSSPEAASWVTSQRLQLIKQFLNPSITFLEIGPGDCSLCMEISKHVKKVYAVDVTEKFKDNLNCRSNFELIISDGSSIPLPENSVDVVYSHQVMEHLHPDDALDQLKNIHNVLVPGGVYICITPNRLSGPHDVSWHFDSIATGLHLKEYSVTELCDLFYEVGFSKVSYYKSYKDYHLILPLILPIRMLLKGIEGFLGLLPYPFRRDVSSLPLLFRGMTVVGKK